MPKGHRAKREAKKPKKKTEKLPSLLSPPVFTSSEVDVVKKKKKSKEQEW